MIKLCAAVALVCVIASGGGVAEDAGGVAAADAAGYPASPETRARAAVLPLVVERAICFRQSRRRTLCLLAHPDLDGRSCRSTVLVHPRRVRVIQRSVCFEFREVNP